MTETSSRQAGRQAGNLSSLRVSTSKSVLPQPQFQTEGINSIQVVAEETFVSDEAKVFIQL